MPFIRRIFLVTLAVFCFALTGAAQDMEKKEMEDHKFGIKSYDAFHALLHPLQHEAVPNKDFDKIRDGAARLILAGNRVLLSGVPKGVKERDKFKTALGEFKTALASLKTESNRCKDEKLEAAFKAVHDGFEVLTDMLPKKDH